MTARRLCFGWHLDATRYSLKAPMPFASGLPPPNSADIAKMRRAFALTSNKGYLVIGEATARLFDCDPESSTVLDLRRYAELPETARELAARLDQKFDMLVLGLAYEINPGSQYKRLVDLLECLSIPVVALDLSVADVEVPAEAMDESVMRLAKFLSERAALFGVRALSTQSWLKRHGIGRAVPVGCPSMYLYPNSVVEMLPPAGAVRDLLFATGGYLLRDTMRAKQHGSLFERVRAHYILQDEIFGLSDRQLNSLRYMDARREFVAEDINALAEQEFGYRPPFDRYFFFDDMHAWRQNLSWHDVYIGDRFHGAVVALQAGRSAVVICKDVRSEEIASYYDLPALSLEKAMSLGLQGVIEEQLSKSRIAQMKSTFVRRAKEFRREIENCGLRLNLHL
jgi:hypothetical protein